MKAKINLLTCAAIMALLLGAAAPLWAQAPARPDAAKAIATLQSSTASELDKDLACRALARVGTAQAVPALAALLGDAHLGTLARNALEVIPDPAAIAALRAALGTLKGRPQIGVVAVLGNRRDRESIPALTQLLAAPDADLAAKAAGALAEIGGAGVPEALLPALAAAPAARKPALADAAMRCAGALVVAGQKAEALAIYDKLCAADGLPAYAVRSATLAALRERGAASVAPVAAAVNSADWSQVSLGLQAARAIPGAAMTQALLGALDGAPAEKQVLILKALADRSEPAILPALLARARQGEPAVRVEALRAVARVADVKSAPALFTLAADPQAEVAAAASDLLAALPGPEMDAAIIAKLNVEDSKVRLLALEVAGKRQIKAAGALLLKMTADPDRKVRLAALGALGRGGGADELAALQVMLMKAPAGELSAIESAMQSIAVRLGDAPATTDKLLAALPGAPVPQRCALLRLVGMLGAPAGLKAIRAAGSDPDPKVKDAAFRALCDWPTAAVAADLLKIAKAPEGAARKVLALRGYIRLIGERGVPAPQKVMMCREAAALAKGDGEKKQLLGMMQGIPNPAVLALAASYAAKPETKNEAGLAVLAIAEKLTSARTVVPGSAAPVKAAMEKLLQTADSEDVKRRARVVLVKLRAAR